jgi:hypothetical protein
MRRPQTLARKRLPHVLGEDWYPTPTDGLRVTLSALADGTYRVSVAGGDDFWLLRDLPTQAEAAALYEALPVPLPQAWLRERGFVPG